MINCSTESMLYLSCVPISENIPFKSSSLALRLTPPTHRHLPLRLKKQSKAIKYTHGCSPGCVEWHIAHGLRVTLRVTPRRRLPIWFLLAAPTIVRLLVDSIIRSALFHQFFLLPVHIVVTAVAEYLSVALQGVRRKQHLSAWVAVQAVWGKRYQ